MFEEKLLNDLKNLQINTSKSITEYMNCYVINYNGLIGVAAETSYDKNLNEKFNGVFLTKVQIKRDEANRNVVFLYVKENNINNFFIRLCCDFLKDSELIGNNPIEWYTGWKNILGNTKKEKMVFDIIAELKTLLYLVKINKKPNWDSIEKSTFDISSIDGFYEVKASQMKTKELITIHNQFQLDTKGLNKPLYIVYCKVEKNDSGDCIDSLVKELVYHGYDANQLEGYLNELGYYDGNIDRSKRYLIHEMREYLVGEDFPRISDSSFIDGKFPKNIIKIEYTVSLDGLEYNKIL